MNIDLMQDTHTVVRANLSAARAVFAVAATGAAIAAAEHHHLSVSPRRFIAGTFMLAGLAVTRHAARLLPAGSPMRVFITGMVDGVPVHWRDLPSFARRRPTPSGVARTP